MASRPRRPPVDRAAPPLTPTPIEAPIHARLFVRGDDEVEVERVAFCPKRGATVAVSVCETCTHFTRIGHDVDGPVVDCAPPADGATAGPAARRLDPSERALRMPVGTLMSRVVTCVTAETPVEKVRVLLQGSGAACAPVVNDDGVLLGIVTPRELLAPPLNATAGQVMTRVAPGLPEDAPLALAIATMAQTRIVALPVLAADGAVVGCISSLDAMRFFGRAWGYDMGTVDTDAAADELA